MKDLVDLHYPNAALISVMLNNLNTHMAANLYATICRRKHAGSSASSTSATRRNTEAG
jgi:hypothetical protein